jgi:hypothetical protein
MKYIRPLAFLCVTFIFLIVSVPLHSSPVLPDAIIIKTSEWAIPSALFEWSSDQLLQEEQVYSFKYKSPVPFTGLSVGWLTKDNEVETTHFEVAIRTRRSGENWTAWSHTNGDIGPNDSPSGLYWGHLYVINDSKVHSDFEVMLDVPAEISLSFVRISVADVSAGLRINSFRNGDTQRASVTSALAAYSQPGILTRSEWWGALPPSELSSPRWPPVYRDITHALIHHTVTENNPANPAQVVRNIWHFHANVRDWGDIGYNFLIDQYGNIYQGRCNGVLDTEDAHAGHASTYNFRSLGVALIGQFHPLCGPETPPPLGPCPPAGEPSTAARQGIEELLAWKFDQRNLDPTEQATLVDRFIYRIAGHSNVASTACPGEDLYDLLPTIRENVSSLIQGNDPPLIDELTVLVEAMDLPKGIDNSLESKIDAAQDALVAANSESRKDAVKKLEAFINAVNAQRGKKITNEQADILMAAANDIIASLSAAAPGRQGRLNPMGKSTTVWGRIKNGQ